MSVERPADALALHRSADAFALREDQLKLGLWMFLATVTMLFAAFTSAYIVRRSGSDWQHVALPSILWVNTGVLAASSLALELRRPRTAFLIGLGFLAGQMAAWRQMVAAGVYLPTSPHSSFFFMMTGAHALHVVAALVVLAWGVKTSRLSAARTFWHYLGGVWLFLLAVVSWL